MEKSMRIRLVENIELNESPRKTKANLNREVRNHLLNILKHTASNTSIDVDLLNNNKNNALIAFILFQNNKSINTEGYVLHHKDFNENNYSCNNIVVLKKEDHDYIHNNILNRCIIDVLQKYYNTEYKRNRIKESDITDEMINLIIKYYMNEQEFFINTLNNAYQL